MPRILVAAGLGPILFGCTQPQPPPPAPVTIVLPSDTDSAPTQETGSVSDAPVLTGKWTHTLPGKDGKDETVVLEYIKDEDSRERFEFLEWPWPEKPDFEKQITNGVETELNFTLESAESEGPPKTLRYVLKKEDGTWTGKLFESWTKVPYDVVLTKLE